MKREQINLEYKEIVTKSFLKTVSAYANYNIGEIVFGISDDGSIVGIENYKEELLRIENMINDSISPRPNYELNIETKENKKIIILKVFKGRNTPYFYNEKAYKRFDSSTVLVDRNELSLLFLNGENKSYEEKASFNNNLTFNELELELKETLNLKNFNNDILKTFGLINEDGKYNIAAELFSDNNPVKFSEIDIVKFGDSNDQILSRDIFEKKSILKQYYESVDVFKRYYEYEEIVDLKRKQINLIPTVAFREALANAVVHRDYSISSKIQISMYDDRLEITSPGGLPFGLTKEQFLYNQISNLRNPIIASVFHRLNIIEKFGTGVNRINQEYAESISKPKFDISETYITIVLPIIKKNMPKLNEDEQLVFNVIKEQYDISRSKIEKTTHFNKDKVLRILNTFIKYEIISKKGVGTNITYRISSNIV